MSENFKEKIYYVKGMHCASCEILIEKNLLNFENIKFVDASKNDGIVKIGYIGKEPDIKELNNSFKKYGYVFFEKPFNLKDKDKTDWEFVFGFVILVFSIIFFLQSLGIGSINITSNSSLPAFFFLGLVASISSCGALIGGLMLSMSRQWNELYFEKDSIKNKFEPYLLFNIGRIISYAILGGIVGFIGGRIQVSLSFSSFLTILVSILMMILGLQMLNVKYFRNFKIALPKFFTRFITDEKKFKGKYMPFFMGALTFFLPCGFTLTAQSLALLSGDFLRASLIMFSFALGTTPGLLVIGFSSVKFLDKKHLANSFSKAAAILVLFFALYNLNSQLNVLGLPNISEFKNSLVNKEMIDQKDLPPIFDGKQVIKMKALAYGYEPNYFKVRAGIPVRWEINVFNVSGCTNAIVSKGLFPEEINLIPGKIIVKEFTPQKPGKYKFSCWMGMISGTIEVI